MLNYQGVWGNEETKMSVREDDRNSDLPRNHGSTKTQLRDLATGRV